MIDRPWLADPDERKRFGLLLGAIVIAFAVQGVAEPGPWEEVIVTALLAATLLLALWIAEVRPRFWQAAFLLAVAMLIASISQAVAGNVDSLPSRLENLLLVTIAPPAIVVGIIRTLRERGRVTLEAVFGVLAVYILGGMFFAFVYGALDRVDRPFFAGGQAATVAHCLYYSFTTLATVGYGDFTARGNLGHTLSVSEALVGQIYLVTIVAVIVSNLGRGRPIQEQDPGTPQGPQGEAPKPSNATGG